MKRIIIIGASSGIGKELALRYAAAGHQVGITARRSPLLQEIQQAYPTQIQVSCFDCRATDASKKLDQLIASLGGMDLFIYNAGYGNPAKAYDLPTEILTTEINVLGGVAMVGAAFQYFLQWGGGQIAITSSVAGLRGNSWAPAYSASKAFLSRYAEGLNIKARKLGQQVFVTDLRPGFVNTKPGQGNKRFWVATTQQATLQIMQAIDQRKRVAYITKRWRLVAWLLKRVPFRLYRRFA